MSEITDFGAFKKRKEEKGAPPVYILDEANDTISFPEQPPTITEAEALALAREIMNRDRTLEIKRFAEDMKSPAREFHTPFNEQDAPRLYEEKLTSDRRVYSESDALFLMRLLEKEKREPGYYSPPQILAISEAFAKRFPEPKK